MMRTDSTKPWSTTMERTLAKLVLETAKINHLKQEEFAARCSEHFRETALQNPIKADIYFGMLATAIWKLSRIEQQTNETEDP